MGVQLDLNVVLAVLKRPVAPLIGFTCQYLFMPLIAAGFAVVFLSKYPALQFGFFCVGCAPGGGVSNMWTILLDGNLDLSVTMTFISSVAALGMMPLWLYTVGQKFFSATNAAKNIKIPFGNLILSLLLLVVPIFFGMLARHLKPNLDARTRKYVRYASLTFVVCSFPLGIWANSHVIPLVTWNTVMCGIGLPWSGYFSGYVVAWLFRQEIKTRVTICLETGIQNSALAIIIMTVSLPKPDGDMAVVMPLCVLIFYPLPIFAVYGWKKLFSKAKRKEKVTNEAASEWETEL